MSQINYPTTGAKVVNGGRITSDGVYQAKSSAGVQSVKLQHGLGTGADGLDVTLLDIDKVEGSLRDDTVTLLTVADAQHGAVSLGRGHDTLVLGGGNGLVLHTLKLDSVEVVKAAPGRVGPVWLNVNGAATFATDGSLNLLALGSGFSLNQPPSPQALLGNKSQQTITYTEMVADTMLHLGGGQDKVVFKAGILFRLDEFGQLVATDGNGSVTLAGYPSNTTNLQIQVGNVTQTYQQWYRTADASAPTASSFTVGSNFVGATSNEAGTLGLYDYNSGNLIGVFSVPMTAGTPAIINVLAQGAVTTAILKVSDQAGNFASDTQSVVLGTSSVDANLVGTIQNDVMFGFDGNDIITGGLGADVLYGGADNDTYMYATSADFVTGAAVVDSIYDTNGTADKAVIAGVISITNTQSLARAEGVEQLLAAAVNDDANGATGALAHSIVINSDTTINDVRTIDLSVSADAQSTGVINLTGVTAAVTGTTLKGVIAGQNTITGGAGVDSITGGNVADTITGGAGVDNLQGGSGADVFALNSAVVDQTGVGEIINGGADTDVLIVAGGTHVVDLSDDTLTSIETLELTKGADNTNADNNVQSLKMMQAQVAALTTINAAATMILSPGDTITLSDAMTATTLDSVTVNGGVILKAADVAGNALTLQNATLGDTSALYLNASALTGSNAFEFNGRSETNSAAKVVFLGGAAGDTFVGTSGDDAVRALGGADILTGGAGNDLFDFTGSDATIDTINDWGDGADTLGGQLAAGGRLNVTIVDASTTAFTAAVIAATNGVVSVTGGAGNDSITGGAGNDSITGGVGVDSLDGGDGNDVFIIAAAADHAAGEAITGGVGSADMIFFTSTANETLTLTANVTTVEVVAISSAGGYPTGTTAENINAAAAVGAIALYGNDGANQLTGNADANVINGGDGNDTIAGGAGVDNLTGGTGADLFSLTGVSAAEDGDTVADFAVGGDKVGLDADFTLVGTVAGTAAAFAAHAFSDTNIGNQAQDYAVGLAGNAWDVIEFTDLDVGRGDLGEATNGSELLKLFYTTNSLPDSSTSLQFSDYTGSLNSSAVNTYLVAYDDGKAYVYLANSGDAWVQAGEITLVGTFNGVTAGTFNAANFTMVG